MKPSPVQSNPFNVGDKVRRNLNYAHWVWLVLSINGSRVSVICEDQNNARADYGADSFVLVESAADTAILQAASEYHEIIAAQDFLSGK